MEGYPVVRVRKGKIKRGDNIWKRKEAVEALNNLCTENKFVYVIDLDGFRKNSPNFDLYKKVYGKLWIDSYPRFVEDVMDLIVVGAERITVRDANSDFLKEIKEICDKEIFLAGNNLKELAKLTKDLEFNGIVLDEEQNFTGELETWKIYLSDETIRRLK
ncbi:MAG: hypothetical protein J7L80_02280 [Thermoplasmata archaeon]|nr:hypothetical protein [Thermoplasmata archaeon]